MTREAPSLEAVFCGTGLIATIVRLLDHPCDRDALSRTSRAFRKAVSEEVAVITCRDMHNLPQLIRRFPNVTSFDLNPICIDLIDLHLQLVARKLPSLKELRSKVTAWKLTDEGLYAIGTLSALQRLHLGDLDCAGEAGLKAIGEGCSSLIDLSLDCQQHRINSFSCVNFRGLQGLFRSCGPRLQSLTLTLDKPLVGNDCLPLVLGCSSLKSLTLTSHVPMYFNQLVNPDMLYKCWNLKTLEVTFSWEAMGRPDINMDGLIKCAVQSGAPLEVVELAGGFTSESLRFLKSCSTLKSFCLHQEVTHIAQGIKGILNANPQLTSLSIQRAGKNFGDDIVTVLSENGQKLEKLVLVSYPLDCELHSLAKCTSLKFLSLSQITSAALPSLPYFPKLEAIMLVYSDPNYIHPESLRSLSRCDRLRRLVVTGLGSSDLEAIAGCVNVEELSIPLGEVTDRCLEVIVSGMCRLRELDIGHCKELREFRFLNLCPKLEKLTLNSTSISDDGMAIVGASCRLLRHLQLSVTAVSDAGLEHLVHCTRLQELDLYDCDSVKGSGVRSLWEACPWLKAVRPSKWGTRLPLAYQ